MTKSVLGRVRAWASKLYTVIWLRHPTYASLTIASYAESMFRLHSDHTRGCVVAGVLHSV